MKNPWKPLFDKMVDKKPTHAVRALQPWQAYSKLHREEVDQLVKRKWWEETYRKERTRREGAGEELKEFEAEELPEDMDPKFLKAPNKIPLAFRHKTVNTELDEASDEEKARVAEVIAEDKLQKQTSFENASDAASSLKNLSAEQRIQ